MRKTRGFTLIELMIAVAIIGILAAVAYPSYQNSVIKGNRATAKAFLMEISQKQSAYLLDRRAYTCNLSDLGLTSANTPKGFSDFYTAEITSCTGTPPAFTVRANPRAGKRQEKDGWIEITSTGAKNSQYPDKW